MNIPEIDKYLREENKLIRFLIFFYDSSSLSNLIFSLLHTCLFKKTPMNHQIFNVIYNWNKNFLYTSHPLTPYTTNDLPCTCISSSSYSLHSLFNLEQDFYLLILYIYKFLMYEYKYK